MFEMTDILARLQNGESAEDIAKEFTAALNAAETEIQKQDEKEQQYTEFKAIMDQTVDYIKRYYPEVEMTEMDEANYRDMFVAMDDLVGFCGDLASAFVNVKPNKRKTITADLSFNTKTDDDVISAFLKSIM